MLCMVCYPAALRFSFALLHAPILALLLVYYGRTTTLTEANAALEALLPRPGRREIYLMREIVCEYVVL